jgi:uncharacterized protein VirK/YbjX
MLLTKLLALRLDLLLLHSVRGAAAVAGLATSLIWLWRWSRRVSPRYDLRGSIGRLRFMMLGLRNHAALDPFVNAPDDGALGRAVRSRPQMLGVLLHASQTTAWDLPTRLDNLVRHFDELAKLDWPELLDPEMSLEIMPLVEIAPRLRLVLDQPIWLCGEGPLVLNLFDGEERLYSLAFALGKQDGLATAQVGAIQGRALPGITEVYRQLTRSSHGMRPRDLLIELFRLFCAIIGIRRILLVSDSHRQHRDAYFNTATDAVVADYDAIWGDRGAHRIDDATFELPLPATRRAADDVPPRKRALYRQRYALLDTLTARMIQRILVMRRAPAPVDPACEPA